MFYLRDKCREEEDYQLLESLFDSARIDRSCLVIPSETANALALQLASNLRADGEFFGYEDGCRRILVAYEQLMAKGLLRNCLLYTSPSPRDA